MRTPTIAAAPSASIPETENPSLPDVGDATPARKEAARLAAAQQEAQRQEAARREAERQEVARNEEAARVEAARQEADRREAARIEAARRDAERHEAARLAAAQEAQRQEAERREGAARVEATRREAERQEVARNEAARREAERQEVARNEAARRETERQEVARAEAREAEARREERLRAIGRQLDEEAAQRQAATASTSPSRALPPPWNLRRYKLIGRTDPNQEIILYAEAFGRKIQMNMTIDMVRDVVKQPHNNPVVTVAIRSDGSVESVTFFQSSGVPALDEAIRRIIDSQKPYQAFPPSLASQYDVLEIRRTWYFERAIRLY
jgi:TolA protein